MKEEVSTLIGEKGLKTSVSEEVVDSAARILSVSGDFSSRCVSFIIPALNERAGIGRVLSRIPREIAREIIVVDSSTDGTGEIARHNGARVIREDRRGYGRALQTGIESATGDVLVYVDADVTYDPREVPRLVNPILRDELDVVLGSRLRGESEPHAMPPLNKIGNKLLSLAFSLASQQWISDSQCGMRAIRRSLLKDVDCSEQGMPYVTEQLLRLVNRGARIGEVPISYRRRFGETKLVPWKDGLQILRSILKNLITENQ
jgi:glycosyltransferase involved in cell wall biosynthesis